jgi:uncharacterized protein (TIGR02246 family)
MKKLNLDFLIFLILFSILFGCAQESKETDVEADIAAIKELYNQYCQAVDASDLDDFMTLWTDDAIRMDHNNFAIIGKEKIRAHFKKRFDPFNNKMILYGETEVQVSGDLAFARGNVTLDITPKEKDTTTHFDVKFLDILKRQEDGSWKIYIDSPSLNPNLSDETFDTDLGKDQDMSDPIL